ARLVEFPHLHQRLQAGSEFLVLPPAALDEARQALAGCQWQEVARTTSLPARPQGTSGLAGWVGRVLARLDEHERTLVLVRVRGASHARRTGAAPDCRSAAECPPAGDGACGGE